MKRKKLKAQPIMKEGLHSHSEELYSLLNRPICASDCLLSWANCLTSILLKNTCMSKRSWSPKLRGSKQITLLGQMFPIFLFDIHQNLNLLNKGKVCSIWQCSSVSRHQWTNNIWLIKMLALYTPFTSSHWIDLEFLMSVDIGIHN